METYRNMADLLREAGIPVTLQRIEIARVMLSRPCHLSAEQILEGVRASTPETSRATVYNTLKLFREKGLVRELFVDRERVVYDSNVAPHNHLYDVDSGRLTDLPADRMRLVGMPELGEGVTLESVDVIVRVRSRVSQAE
ncbi:MAG: Fur family transcriptional regulator [Rhodocyclaceae bacterium]|jgi:Fur family iron response transcriptional regulator|nr:Fur family transcriptional regulator [Rhodocyclaceae bacterium]